MSTLSAHDATSITDCKTPGCTNDAVAKLGRYAGLCSDCIQRQRLSAPAAARPAPVPAQPTTPRPGPTEGITANLKTLAALAREVDKLNARARAATEKALQAKRAADAKEREFRALARELIGDAA